MTTLRDAAQQALEAMEVWRDSLFDENALPGWRFSVLGEKAITDLRAALSEEAMQRLTDEQQMIERGTKAWAGVPDATAWVEELRGNEPVTDCHEKEGDKLAPPSDHVRDATKMIEPVAWMVYTLDGQSVFITDNAADFTQENRALPLYTAPPKREPLTDEEISKIFIYCGRDKETFARAIERAHGIGGEE